MRGGYKRYEKTLSSHLCQNHYLTRTTKKAGLHYCCSANRGSGIAFFIQTATPSPRRMYMLLHVTCCSTRIYAYINTYHRHLSVALSWIKSQKFTRFRLTKTKRVKTLFIMSCTPPALIGHFPT